jgi:hypothetical protein
VLFSTGAVKQITALARVAAACPTTAPAVSAVSSRQASTNAGSNAWLTRHRQQRSRGTKILRQRPACRM